MGKHALLIEWPNRIDESILDNIIHFTRILEAQKDSDLINYTPAYNSILLQYTKDVDIIKKSKRVLILYETTASISSIKPTVWDIPVCYDETFGLDHSLFIDKGLTREEVVSIHTSASYRVYMIGFLPGFLYLGGLSERLYMPRKNKPRQRVPKGSVGIGGEQTGIYPLESPGGWQIIGRTPFSLFDKNKDSPCQIKQGDVIQFYPIDRNEYDNLLSH